MLKVVFRRGGMAMLELWWAIVSLGGIRDVAAGWGNFGGRSVVGLGRASDRSRASNVFCCRHSFLLFQTSLQQQ